MKLHFLRYFAVLGEELHFGRAADRLAITQPPLSSAIKALEQELGVQLLERDSRRVRLTPAGAAFLVEAQQILERVEKATSIAKTVAGGMRGRLEVGVTGSLLYRKAPAIVQAYRREMPGVDVVLREMSTADQTSALLHGQLQAGFVNAAAVPPPLASMPLPQDEFVVCLPSNHPKANATRVRLTDLASEQFVMFSRDVAPANHDNVIAIFSQAGIHPTTVHAARQWLTIIAMVAHGLGVALVPRSLSRSKVDGVTFVRLRDVSAASPALLAWNPDFETPAVTSFLACAQQVMEGS
ncbi:LysR family transcriptional regulator [Ramlibacter algicola]|uniref:LysR family transcriptional regulator n=1 Tax=Ramlibacter algicola TaxID=2795217 RepID=A0A934PYB2_9BURK|nr:LysR family transcriptional regulator [Ramlibacter algicola]MBK0392780.1 LysR family transcriptional regulator [Ramlibacter algicola]